MTSGHAAPSASALPLPPPSAGSLTWTLLFYCFFSLLSLHCLPRWSHLQSAVVRMTSLVMSSHWKCHQDIRVRTATTSSILSGFQLGRRHRDPTQVHNVSSHPRDVLGHEGHLDRELALTVPMESWPEAHVCAEEPGNSASNSSRGLGRSVSLLGARLPEGDTWEAQSRAPRRRARPAPAAKGTEPGPSRSPAMELAVCSAPSSHGGPACVHVHEYTCVCACVHICVCRRG